MKKSFGKISFVVILVNLLIFSVYVANQNKENEKQVVDETVVYATETQTEDEPVISYSLVDDAKEYENGEGYKIYRDDDVPDEDVEKLLSRLLRLRNVDGVEKFCKAVTWYITTDESVTSMFAVDQPSATFMIYDGPEYEIYLEQISMIVQASVRDSGKEM
ncbi:hypothetical protein [Pseudobutyrivibrio ruminis]|uniref:hypothetical protein n=1 Tax=Pseudobutyrivibrio ruminis TaxID=46206 RepID=UPI00051C8F4D|nr:hypothetical protein [Pseudobutyrivibrio ruminis]